MKGVRLTLRINNTENDILEAVTNVMLEYREGIYC